MTQRKRRCHRASRRRREGLQEMIFACMIVLMFATGIPLAIAMGLQMASH